MNMYNEEAHLESFQPIFLEEMKGVELLNRIDTKFVFSRKVLNEILPRLAEHYKVLEVEGKRVSAYETQYFDTDDFRFYLDHHNGKGLRYKVRIRKYVESAIYFLEIKKKHKGRTDKKRISLTNFEKDLSTESKEFIAKAVGKEIVLEEKLFNLFRRITLVSNTSAERLTIDVDLAYKSNTSNNNIDHIVIAELKQDGFNTLSPFYRLMKEYIVRPVGFSKYCIGAIKTNADLKYNNFKTRLLLIDKLKNYE